MLSSYRNVTATLLQLSKLKLLFPCIFDQLSLLSQFIYVCRVLTGQGEVEKVGEFVLSGKVREISGKNVIFEKSGKMILDHADCG